MSGYGGAAVSSALRLARQCEREKARAGEWSEWRVHDVYAPVLA